MTAPLKPPLGVRFTVASTPLVAAEPHKFLMPSTSDLRYNWVEVRLEAIDHEEMRELVLDAWRMVVPKRVAVEHLGD